MDNLIISVGRQIGSGGCEIAQMLAKEFGCKFYDKEIINLAAEKSGFNPKVFERCDESHGLIQSVGGFFERLFNPYSNSISSENLFQIQSEVIFKIGKNENCVIMGRCADYILRNNPNLFSVFITADDDVRFKEVARRLDSDYETARKFVLKHETERASYYNYYTSKTWGAAQNYDLCINSSILGWEGTANLISSIIRKKFNLLTLQA
jgi:cytidylate kinase